MLEGPMSRGMIPSWRACDSCLLGSSGRRVYSGGVDFRQAGSGPETHRFVNTDRRERVVIRRKGQAHEHGVVGLESGDLAERRDVPKLHRAVVVSGSECFAIVSEGQRPYGNIVAAQGAAASSGNVPKPNLFAVADRDEPPAI